MYHSDYSIDCKQSHHCELCVNAIDNFKKIVGSPETDKIYVVSFTNRTVVVIKHITSESCDTYTRCRDNPNRTCTHCRVKSAVPYDPNDFGRINNGVKYIAVDKKSPMFLQDLCG